MNQVAPMLFVGGQFHQSQWPELYQIGIRAVLNLQAEREDRFSGPPPVRSLRLLVPDFHAPTITQISEGVAFIAAAHAERLPVLVHCHAGVGRAPLIAAAYLVAVHDMHYRSAIAHLRAARPIIAPNPRQIARLREYELWQRRA
ncbi:dual specificity protein phosphatase family protein [Oscillochloris sp. ZM17-4]|uniref:dual specificity protein phosphatase family protein n=1 Tax=Oscillochloris sp. ZM17-4 TaxID=2866714 RepID=UPI00351D1A2A